MVLFSKNILIAEHWLRCDALSIWLDVVENFTKKDKEKGISIWFNARHQIMEGEPYWHFEFVDDDGELHEMNCRLDMHTLMLENSFYPKIILSLLNG